MYKVGLLRIHEQHQHLQHLLDHTPAVALQYELCGMDLQHLHIPHLLVRHLHWTNLRCQRSSASCFHRKCLDDGQHNAHGCMYRYVEENSEKLLSRDLIFAHDAHQNTGNSLSCLVSLEVLALPSSLHLPQQLSDTSSCSSVATPQASHVQEGPLEE